MTLRIWKRQLEAGTDRKANVFPKKLITLSGSQSTLKVMRKTSFM